MSAACRGMIDKDRRGDDQWHPRFPVLSGPGKRFCYGPDPENRPDLECPVRETCLAWALTHNIKSGPWGGLSQWERQELFSGSDAPPDTTAGTEVRRVGIMPGSA